MQLFWCAIVFLRLTFGSVGNLIVVPFISVCFWFWFWFWFSVHFMRMKCACACAQKAQPNRMRKCASLAVFWICNTGIYLVFRYCHLTDRFAVHHFTINILQQNAFSSLNVGNKNICNPKGFTLSLSLSPSFTIINSRWLYYEI